MHIHDLPSDILDLILDILEWTDLHQCVLVSRRFSTSATIILWRTLDLTRTDRFARFREAIVEAKETHGHHCRELCLEKAWDDDLLFCIERMPFLEVLDIRDSEQLGDASVSQLPRYCPQLRRLSLENTSVTHRSAHHLGRCKQLRELSFHHCQLLMSMSLLPFADCPLEMLDLAGCKWLNAKDTATDLHAFRHLKHLSLICCQDLSTRFIEVLTETAVAMPDLRFISLTGSALIDDDAIIPFVQSHPLLESVHLLQCAISDKTIDAIKTYLPNVRAIDVSYCSYLTANSIRQLIRTCPHLMMIGLRECALQRSEFMDIDLTDESEEPENEFVDSLGYFELEQIRFAPERMEPPASLPPPSPQSLASPPMQIAQNPVDALTESYSYIQEYLDRV